MKNFANLYFFIILVRLNSLKRGHQASAVSKNVGGLASWSAAHAGSPGTALTVGGWIRPGEQNKTRGVERESSFDTTPSVRSSVY